LLFGAAFFAMANSSLMIAVIPLVLPEKAKHGPLDLLFATEVTELGVVEAVAVDHLRELFDGRVLPRIARRVDLAVVLEAKDGRVVPDGYIGVLDHLKCLSRSMRQTVSIGRSPRFIS
jgi:hypothetical protein